MLLPHEKDNYPKTFWALLPKMFVMVTGEQEFMNIPFASDGYRVWETAYFLVFMMLTVVILLNMLNGLAVADAKTMLDASETDSFCSLLATAAFWVRRVEKVKNGKNCFGFALLWAIKEFGGLNVLKQKASKRTQMQAGLHVARTETKYRFYVFEDGNKNLCGAVGTN